MNYRHLRYFWMVARTGGVAAAARSLHLTPQTLSGQIHQLEEALGRQLLRPAGRRVELTEDGRTAFRLADAIFSLGGELEDRFKGGRGLEAVVDFRVGVTEAVPKTVAYRLLAPAGRLDTPVRITNRSGPFDELLADLAAHRVDLVLADAPMPASTSVRAFNHRLGRCGVSFFAAPALLGRRRRRFPAMLNDLPLLVPGPHTSVSTHLKRWLEVRELCPTIAGVFDDSALMKAFGEGGQGVFIAPTAIERDVVKRYGVRCIGRTDEITEEFFAISVERRIKHPCVAVVTETARSAFLA